MEQSSGCKRCRSWEEEIYWKHFNSMHFFLFLPKDFHHHLVLPPRFAENMMAKLPDKVSLIGPSATVWDIELKKTDTIEFGGDGWIEFVRAHELEEKDLLMFKYQQNSSFEVLIFDPKSLCEKEASYFVKQCRHGNAGHENGKKKVTGAFSVEIIEDEENEYDDYNDPEFVVSKKSSNDVAEDPGRRKSPRTSRKEREPEKYGAIHGGVEKEPEEKGAEKEAGENEIVHEVAEEEPEENGAAKEQNTVDNGGRVVQTTHRRKYSRKKGVPKRLVSPRSPKRLVLLCERESEENGLVHDVIDQEPEESGPAKEQRRISEREQNTLENEGNVLEAAHSHIATVKKGRPKKQVSIESSRKLVVQTEKKYSKEVYKSNRSRVTEIEKENAMKRALQALQRLTVKSFIAVMRPSAVYMRFYVNVPAGFFNKNVLGRNREVMLRVGEKTWQAMFYCNRRREGGFSGCGWKKFAVDNFLEEFDVCLFKLASPEDDLNIVMDIEIFRVIRDIVPSTPPVRSTSM